MKNLLKWLLILTIYALSVKPTQGQTAVKSTDGKTYSAVKKQAAPAKDSGKVFQDAKGNKYPIMISENGRYFVVRTSQKTGKTYKQYLQL